jgi:hypothetical protein
LGNDFLTAKHGFFEMTNVLQELEGKFVLSPIIEVKVILVGKKIKRGKNVEPIKEQEKNSKGKNIKAKEEVCNSN